MIILVLNCGSSSIKFRLYEMNQELELASGLIERIGSDESIFKYKSGKTGELKNMLPVKTHSIGISEIINKLCSKEFGVISSISEICSVGHRVVHGGEKFSASILIDTEVLKEIENCIPLAPLHNPPNLAGILACKEIMPNIPQIAVFDTAFHQTLPDYAYVYPIPYQLYKNDRIRKYGFHGTSHRYVSIEAAKMIGKKLEDLKIISCHLGNGASIAAIKYGKSIDTSMGYTPLEGIMMGTRSGSIDPAIIFHLMRVKKLSVDDCDELLNKMSGFLGISGISNDARDIVEGAKRNEYRSDLALKMYAYKVKNYIGSYSAIMGGVDLVIITAGVGENTEEIREYALEGLEYLGINLDKNRNLTDMKKTREITTDDSKVKVYVIFTNEEIMIARDTKYIYENINGN
jgi:acetate kinase